jgi:hypothetical protein
MMSTPGTADREPDVLADPEARRYLAHSEVTFGPRTRLVIAAIADQRTIDELRPDAAIERMLPHDALLVLERTDPDLVLVDTAALRPGRAWAHAGDPSTGDRGRRLVEILRAARARGRPTVLWWNGQRDHAVGLIPLERSFDLVVATGLADTSDPAVPWTSGVQLRRWNPLGADPERPCNPVFEWQADTVTWRTAERTRQLLSAVAGAGLEIWRDADEPTGRVPLPPEYAGLATAIDPRRLPDRVRQHGLFLGGPPTGPADTHFVRRTALQQLASGARVASVADEPLARSFGDIVSWIGASEAGDAAGAAGTAGPADRAMDAVREAAARGPLSAAERRDVLRIIHRRHATAVALRSLAGYLGLAPELTASRDVCLIAIPGPEQRPIDIVDAILRQEQRPTEALFLTDEPGPLRPYLLELERAGVRGRVGPPPDDGQDVLRWAADLTQASWMWAWAPGVDHASTFLLDCLIGGQMAPAAAIGTVDGETERFVEELAVSRAIVARADALARPDARDGDLGVWARRGAVLLGIATPSGPA